MTLELRDDMTHIPAAAIRVVANDPDADYTLGGAGFDKGTSYVLLTDLLTSASRLDAAGRKQAERVAAKKRNRGWPSGRPRLRYQALNPPSIIRLAPVT
jgi:hypothetical protein